MTLTIGTASGNKSATSMTVGTTSGNKAVSEGWVGTASGNKQFFSSLSALISPGSAAWVFGGISYQSVPDFTATPVDGAAPYAYAWEATGDATAGNPASAMTPFLSFTGAPQNVRCLITDNNGATAYTPYSSIS